MEPNFALTRSDDEIGLLQRTALGWLEIGKKIRFDTPDLAEALSSLRRLALGLAPKGITTKLVIPNSQILYADVEAPASDLPTRHKQIRAALQKLSPYDVQDLVFDCFGSGPIVRVAAVAREVLDEAEAFAVEARFNPLSFVAIPPPGAFGKAAPWFGPTAVSRHLLPDDSKVEPDNIIVTFVADVNDKGEVTVVGELLGRLDGFHFLLEARWPPDEARKLRQSVEAVLKPEFHLRADRFYNAPDTEMDFTEQGGLMWGSTAVGKLVKGPEVTRPLVEPFVDEEAGPEVADKVRRRLQHFIDRKVALNFEPLLAMGRDETLVGLTRAFAFRLVEDLGVLRTDAAIDDVIDLGQDELGALRRHGVHFGRYAIFVQPLLEPAPTRLRLVLWSLYNGLREFPESPPTGLVTIPNLRDVPTNYYTLAGYHPASAHAIRIDILERLANLAGSIDRKTSFEPSPEMLSITGMTLEQFKSLANELADAGLVVFDLERQEIDMMELLSRASALEHRSYRYRGKSLGPVGPSRSQAFSPETKRKRVMVPTKPGATGDAAAAGGGPHLGEPSKRPAGISDAEMERRMTALRAAKAREADEEATRQSEQAASHSREAEESVRSAAEENAQDERSRANTENRSSSNVDPRSGQVKQSFSHGRTTSVVGEVKRTPLLVPNKGAPTPGTAESVTTSPPQGEPPKQPGGISDAEMERRLAALRAAKDREDEDAAKRAEDERAKADAEAAGQTRNQTQMADERSTIEAKRHSEATPNVNTLVQDLELHSSIRKRAAYAIQQDPPRSRALLVGISAYDDLEDLQFARKDAEDMARALIDHFGFDESEIELMTCSTPRKTKAAFRYIEEVLVNLKNSGGHDLFLFGYWGHGVTPNHSELHLTAVDSDKRDLIGTSLSLDFIMSCVRSVRAKDTVVLLDCCQSPPELSRNALSGMSEEAAKSIINAASRLAILDEPHEQIGEYGSTAVFSACRMGERAYEWKSERNGYFTAHFLKAMTEGMSRITDISRFVTRNTQIAVRKDLGRPQSPWLELKGSGDIDLRRKPKIKQ